MQMKGSLGDHSRLCGLQSFSLGPFAWKCMWQESWQEEPVNAPSLHKTLPFGTLKTESGQDAEK